MYALIYLAVVSSKVTELHSAFHNDSKHLQTLIETRQN